MSDKDLSRRAALSAVAGLGFACLSPRPGHAAGANDIPRLAQAPHRSDRGMVSITYDDGLSSQLQYAVPALAEAGLSATFYVTYRNIRNRLDAWKRLAAQGHELANHSFNHPCDLQRMKVSDYLEREVLPMERWLDAACGAERVATFAYPCDVTNLGRGNANHQAARFDRLLQTCQIAAARTSEGAPNNPRRLQQRRYRLQALSVGYDARTLDAVTAYLDLARVRNHWAILVFHGIGAGDDGAVSVGLHRDIIDLIAHSGLRSAPLGAMFASLIATSDHAPVSQLDAQRR